MAKPQDINEPFSDELLSILGDGGESTPSEVVETQEAAIEDGSEASEQVTEDDIEVDEDSRENQGDDGLDTDGGSSDNSDGDVVGDDPYEKRYKDLQSFSTKQAEELRAQMQQQQALINELLLKSNAPQEQQQQAVDTRINDKQLSDGIASNPEDSLAWVVHNRPDLVSKAIGMIRQHHGDEMAIQAATDYQIFTAQQQAMQLQQYQQQLEEQRLQAEMPQVIQTGIHSILDQVSQHYGDDFKRLAPRLNEELSKLQTIDDPCPEGIRNLVERHFLAIMKEDLVNKRIEQSKKPRKLEAGESVDAGTPGQAPTPSGDDELVDELVKAHRAGQYK